MIPGPQGMLAKIGSFLTVFITVILAFAGVICACCPSGQRRELARLRVQPPCLLMTLQRACARLLADVSFGTLDDQVPTFTRAVMDTFSASMVRRHAASPACHGVLSPATLVRSPCRLTPACQHRTESS